MLNDPWALQAAKNNVERYYPVVGILEELNSTLEVLESNIPYFFKGVQKLYYKDLLGKTIFTLLMSTAYPKIRGQYFGSVY